MDYIGLDYTIVVGLNYTGLEYTIEVGLNYIGLDYIGLDCFVAVLTLHLTPSVARYNESYHPSILWLDLSLPTAGPDTFLSLDTVTDFPVFRSSS